MGHRLDVRIRPNLQIALTEMATYGGLGRDFEMAFMNPLTFYYPIQRNDKKQMNGFWALDVFYKPFPNWTFYSQFLIDDIIVNNVPGQDDRSRYPDRFGMHLSVRSADLIAVGTNINLTYTRVWNRTYQSKFTWENYHYRGLGLGYPRAGCEEVKVSLSYWGLFPLYFQNKTTFGRYGNVELSDIFPLMKEPFPVPPVQSNWVNHFTLHYFYRPTLKFLFDVKYRQKPEHYTNRLEQDSGFVFVVGCEWLLNLPVNIN
ncbi:MAG TPA: hypothetical protein ENN22_13180 [bacterium]|nr:hypothetical protein [bacterium]